MNIEVRNKVFYEKCRILVIKAPDALRSSSYTEDEKKANAVASYGRESDQGLPAGQAQISLSPSQLIRRQMNDLVRLPEINPWLEVMQKDEAISRHMGRLVGTQQSLVSTRITEWGILFRFLINQLDKPSGGCEFDSGIFDQTYKELEQFLYSNYVTLRVFAPLSYFSSDVDEIDLSNDVKIRKIDVMDPRFKSYLLFRDDSSPRFLDEATLKNLGFPKYAVEIVCKARKVFWEEGGYKPVSDEKDELNKLLVALRLFKLGVVYYDVVEAEPTISLLGPYIARSYPADYADYWSYEPHRILNKMIYHSSEEDTRVRDELRRLWSNSVPYVLNRAEIQDFKKLWFIIRGVDLEENASLAIALDRFNYGYGRQRLEDKLIDYFTAFEALLLRGVGGELSHRLAVRVACLLNQKYEDKVETYRKMERLYNARSRVLHGHIKEIAPEFVLDVEKLLKDSIKKFFEELQEHNYDEILSRLDLGEK